MDMQTFYGEPWANGPDAGFAFMLVGMYLIIAGIAMLYGVVQYVLQSLSLYTIAKRRGLNHPWLSWIPVGAEWILGSLSDQYQYVVNRKVQSRRKVLLGLSIAMLAVGLVAVVALVGFVAAAVAADMGGYDMATGSILGGFFGLFAGLQALFVLLIVHTVFYYICLYNVFKSCDPSTSTMFLVLSILIGVTQPFFLLADRNKDLGMPPRRDQPRQEAPQSQPPEPAQIPAPAPEQPEQPEEPREEPPELL